MSAGTLDIGSLSRVLLLNPPASSPVLRDYYCSTRPKANYYWQPIDLLCLAAQLRGRARIMLLDAAAQQTPAKQVRKIIKAYQPEAVYCLASTLSFQEDMAFLQKIANEKTRVVIGGEAALAPDFPFEDFPFIDALALDFTAPELGEFILEGKASGRLRTRDRAPAPPPKGVEYSMGVPPHNLVDNALYKLPLWKGVFHSLLTDFGCPYKCSFCNSGLDGLGYKSRNLAEIEKELNLLKTLEARQIYLRDMTFGAELNRGMEVLNLLSRYSFALRGYLRADQVTPAFAKALKKGGFQMAQIGVESPSMIQRKALGKNISDEVFYQAFRLLREQGIEAGAHFIIGFEEDPPLAAMDCLTMAKKLNAAYCSINVIQDRLGARPNLLADSLRRPWFKLQSQAAMALYNAPKQAMFLFSKPW
ncbi:B12-binding domain-containing radical SAM protein [Desulfatibacillum aliphaticivorans]|uniref:B12-binding domain-containing radical SAM protein n=1 Tax=Desulfatibacillum aliphaticivorans TaxID=218208 RepID=UPI000423C51A|nr:radical SAM protein [Desulfatibacillum aliphaticivorans]